MADLFPAGKFLSTPSARRATFCRAVQFQGRPISIHALREEGDLSGIQIGIYSTVFLSTPSARRATGGPASRPHRAQYFYPRPPRGGRRGRHQLQSFLRDFYPRPPRGGRPRDEAEEWCDRIFLSTPSARRATETFFKDNWPKIFLSTPSARRATAKTETKSLFSNKLYNILHEFRRALIYNGSKSYPNHAK